MMERIAELGKIHEALMRLLKLLKNMWRKENKNERITILIPREFNLHFAKQLHNSIENVDRAINNMPKCCFKREIMKLQQMKANLQKELLNEQKKLNMAN